MLLSSNHHVLSWLAVFSSVQLALRFSVEARILFNSSVEYLGERMFEEPLVSAPPNTLSSSHSLHPSSTSSHSKSDSVSRSTASLRVKLASIRISETSSNLQTKTQSTSSYTKPGSTTSSISTPLIIRKFLSSSSSSSFSTSPSSPSSSSSTSSSSSPSHKFSIDESDLDHIILGRDWEPEVSTASTTTAIPIQYLVVPTPGLTLLQEQNFVQDTLQPLSQLPVERILRNNNSAFYWKAFLTPYNAAVVHSNPDVYLCFTDTIDVVDEAYNMNWTTTHSSPISKRTSTPLRIHIENRRWVEDDFISLESYDWPLLQISNPPGWNPIDTDSYDFYKTGGSQTTIYLIDSGANTESDEYKYIKLHNHVRWERVNSAWGENDQHDHGTCVLSKAVGVNFGTAKFASVVVVKIRDVVPFKYSDLLAGLAWVLGDIKSKDLRGKAVINLSLIWTAFVTKDENKENIIELHRMFTELISNDAVVVAASGNHGLISDDISGFPALFARDLSVGADGGVRLPALPIIVVGSVEDNGQRSPFSQGTSLLSLSAYGNGLCGSGLSTGSEIMHGTSLAAPLVAGVAALILSAPSFYSYPRPGLQPGGTCQEVKDYLQNLAYPRILGGFPVLWNGINLHCDTDDPPAPPPPPPRGSVVIAPENRYAIAAAAASSCPSRDPITISTSTMLFPR